MAETYSKASKATNKNNLSDPYVKAIRWASDRIGTEGVIALVTNSGFVDGIAADGMRKHLSGDFDEIFIPDLGGNVRKNPKLSGTTHNVFGIQVGVSINLFIRRNIPREKRVCNIWYAKTDDWWTKEQKYSYLESRPDLHAVDWQRLQQDGANNWLTSGMDDSFARFTPISPNGIFARDSNGVKTNRDAWAYNADRNKLATNIERLTRFYNAEIDRWKRSDHEQDVDSFVQYDESSISWSRDLKQDLKRGRKVAFDPAKVRNCLYRPFAKSYLFFDRIVNEEVYAMPVTLPSGFCEQENVLICDTGIGAERPFATTATNLIPDLNFYGPGTVPKWFPFYTYDEDGANRRENITDWALAEFRRQYGDSSISKWDIFHYTYALLHHPEYRTRYAANLKRELPHIPMAPEFRHYAEIGQRLMDIHIHYEQQPECSLQRTETGKLNWRVEKMVLSKDKTQLRYNGFLTLSDIPPEIYEYRLGNRSALEWIVDQYQISTDKRSGIVNDPNRPDDPEYIVRLIGQVITVSLKTVQLTRELRSLGTR